MVYAINRIVQVRTGAIEANLKLFCSRLFHKENRDTHYGNGINREELAAQCSNTTSLDLNGTVQEQPAYQSLFTNMTPVDLNGRMLSETENQFDSSHTVVEGKERFIRESELCRISIDEFQRVQVS